MFKKTITDETVKKRYNPSATIANGTLIAKKNTIAIGGKWRKK